MSTTERISTRNLGFLPLVVYSFYDIVSLHEGIIRIIINFIVESTLYDRTGKVEIVGSLGLSGHPSSLSYLM